METVIRTKIKDLLKAEAGKEVLAKGWVRTKRGNKNVAFIALNDGSTINNIQIVVDKTPENEAHNLRRRGIHRSVRGQDSGA